MTCNYSQSYLNSQYNQLYEKEYTGTCSEVAITSLVEYYHRKNKDSGRISSIKGFDGTTDSSGAIGVWKDQFYQILDIAIDNEAYDIYDPKGGTWPSKICGIITDYYDVYKKKLEGNRDTTLIKSTIKSYNDSAKPVIGNLTAPNGEGHTIVIAGFYDITVAYRNNTSEKWKSKTYRYYAINDGRKTCLEGDKRIQYVRAEYLDSDITKIVKE